MLRSLEMGIVVTKGGGILTARLLMIVDMFIGFELGIKRGILIDLQSIHLSQEPVN